MLLAELFVEELDFSESDPTCKEGFRVVYAKEVPFEMRLQETEEAPQEVGTLEAILAKVAVQGDPAAPTAIKVELSSESDLFFHYSHVVDERAFKQLREEQRLMIEFNDYANVLARSLNQAIKEPQTHLAVYIMNRDGQARLDFIQTMEYKFVELLSVAFLRSPDDLIRQAVAFRYNSLKAKVQVLTSRLSEVTSIVKIKNPSRALPRKRPLLHLPAAPRRPLTRARCPLFHFCSAAAAAAEPRADGGGGGRRDCSWERCCRLEGRALRGKSGDCAVEGALAAYRALPAATGGAAAPPRRAAKGRSATRACSRRSSQSWPLRRRRARARCSRRRRGSRAGSRR